LVTALFNYVFNYETYEASKKNHKMITNSELGRMWNDAVLPQNLSGRTDESHKNPEQTENPEAETRTLEPKS
jgi:hypothetical protein